MAELSAHMRRLVQPHLADIEPYDPAFASTRINLSANESTYPLPDGVREAIDEALTATQLNRYPDSMANALRDELAAWHGLSRENVCVGNGGDELIFNFLYAFGGEERTLLICPPCFSEYAFFAALAQTVVRKVFRDPSTMLLDQDATLAAASQSDLVIVTSPNNPTGDVMPLDFIDELCRVCPGLVMADEAYMEFADAGASARPLLASHTNLIILHTLSKLFGLAGARLGYVLAASEVIDVFAAVRQIYSVNALSQAAARAVVCHRASFLATADVVRSERERMYVALSRMATSQVQVWPSQGNFLLVRVPQAAELRCRLRDEFSILVRDFSSEAGLDGCLRITVGTPEENTAVLKALATILE